ncbi:SPOSA6832_02116, partial [Sporobolomyces salmonicolor]
MVAASTSSAPQAADQLLPRLLPHLDRHLVLPLLDFLESREKYSHDEVLKAKIDLLGKTNMVTFVEGMQRELEGKADGEEVQGAEGQSREFAQRVSLDRLRWFGPGRVRSGPREGWGSEAVEVDHRIKTRRGPALRQGPASLFVVDQDKYRKREQEVVKTLNELQAQAQGVMEVISNPEVVSALRQDKQHNLNYLKENHNMTLEQIALLYRFGQFQYSIGHYAGASDYLYHFRVLSTDSSLVLSAMWGKLAADILEGSWDAALEELNGLREHIDQRGSAGPGGPLVALQQRTWWLHWSLFVYYNHPNGREALLESWLNQNYLNTLQTSAPWLLRYLVAAVVISRKSTLRSAAAGNSARSREAVRDVVRALGQEQYQYSDAVTEFLRKLYGEVDFEGAREEMAKAAGGELEDDFFLEQFKDEFVENARYLVSEAYCKIHHRIDIGELSDRLGMTREEGERWIVDLVRDARLDAKIDLKQVRRCSPFSFSCRSRRSPNASAHPVRKNKKKNIVQMNHADTPVYQTVIEKSRGLLFRSQAIASAIEIRAAGGAVDRDQQRMGGRGGRGGRGGARGGGAGGRGGAPTAGLGRAADGPAQEGSARFRRLRPRVQ